MRLLIFLFVCLFIAPQVGFTKTGGELLGTIPVQDNGRIKPFDTFARETLKLIYGKEKYNGKPATEIVFTWFLLPDHWTTTEMFQLRRAALKESMGLEKERTYFSREELLKNEKLSLLVQELDNKTQAEEKLNPYWQDVQRLKAQLGLFHAVATGEALRWVPAADSDTWKPVAALEGVPQEKFVAMTRTLPEKLTDPGSTHFDEAFKNFQTSFSTPDVDQNKIRAELHLNSFHPFRWAWVAYLIAALCVVVTWLRPGTRMLAAWHFYILGFLLHTYGFALRIYLTGRPPVSNMYETVVWVPYGTVIFGWVFEYLYKKKYTLFGASIVSVFCLVVADMAPVILDPSLIPLEAVLRSNYWLTIHVLTITISYSAFFLAMLLGDIGLVQFVKSRGKANLKDLALLTYRVLQIGVVLLAAGTILGGVWADASWGRFWGWDPKETWAFIALLGYLALLHARKGGYIHEFGVLAGSVLAFSLVVMAWYGVNYVLGAGLHSYGFGGGGLPFVSAMVGVHVVFVVFCSVVHRGQLKSN